jgi:hypothetical protein
MALRERFLATHHMERIKEHKQRKSTSSDLTDGQGFVEA